MITVTLCVFQVTTVMFSGRLNYFFIAITQCDSSLTRLRISGRFATNRASKKTR